jgi:hypothetical protein
VIAKVFPAGENVRRQRSADFLELVADVAVFVDGIDDRLADRGRARVEVLQFELPEQVVRQGFLGTVGLFEFDIRFRRSGRIGRAGALDVVPVRIVAEFRLGRLLALGRLRSLGGHWFLGLEHDVLFQRIANLGLQLHDRQLQQPDGLLQLRCHCQLLSQPQL